MSDSMQPEEPGVDALRERLERDIAATPPDFADVLARMQARSDEQLPSLALPEDPEPESSTIAGEDEQLREQLAPACAVLRERVEASLAEADMRPLPTPVQRSRAPAMVAAAVLLAAAAIALAFVAPRLSTRLSQQQQGSLSVDEQRGGSEAGRALPRESEAAVERRAAAVSPEPTPEPVEDETPEPLEGGDAELEQQDRVEEQPAAPAKAKRPRVPLGERLDALDREAQERWQAGDTVGAAKLYCRLIDIGGKHPKVELAYAELFALTRASGGALAPHWRKYLRRFPTGRYAREAKAGLCRQVPSSEREACWAEYEEVFGPR